jgi:hypothetical protein
MLAPGEIEGRRLAAGCFTGSEDLDFRKAVAGTMQNSIEKVRACNDVDFGWHGDHVTVGGTTVTVCGKEHVGLSAARQQPALT